MIYKLRENEHEKALPIFNGLRCNLAIKAVIEGNSLGKIYVDDLTNPKTAFASVKPSEYYLAGHPNNDEFNSSVEKLINEEISTEEKQRGNNFSILHYFPDAWETKIDVILKNQSPMKGYRRFYAFKQLKVDWKNKIPSGFRMKRVDKELLRGSNLKNINKVTDLINSHWNSIDDFLERGFGFCLLYGDKIVSWCLSRYKSGKKCEISIQTDKKYRNQGFATLTASAFIENCISKNLTPTWHCWNSNLPSIVLAEKVGFKKQLVYSVYYWHWYTSTLEYLFWLMKNEPKKSVFASIEIFRDLPHLRA